MFNSKKIKELEKDIETITTAHNIIAKLIHNLVTEHTTGLLIKKENAKEIEVRMWSNARHDFIPYDSVEIKSKRYYLKDKAPDCDYIKIENCKETYYKNNVIVDAKGVCKK